MRRPAEYPVQKDGDKDFVRVDWRHGVVFAPPDGMFHQHFNTNPTPARYLAIAVGSMRYPLVAAKRNLFDLGVDTSVKDGGNQIEYQDQDPRIHQLYLQELAKSGVASGMGKFVDENRLREYSANSDPHGEERRHSRRSLRKLGYVRRVSNYEARYGEAASVATSFETAARKSGLPDLRI